MHSYSTAVWTSSPVAALEIRLQDSKDGCCSVSVQNACRVVINVEDRRLDGGQDEEKGRQRPGVRCILPSNWHRFGHAFHLSECL